MLYVELVITQFVSSQAASWSLFLFLFKQKKSKECKEWTCALLVIDHTRVKSELLYLLCLVSIFLTTAGVTHSFQRVWTCRISRYTPGVWTKRKSVLILLLQNRIHSMTQTRFVLFLSFKCDRVMVIMFHDGMDLKRPIFQTGFDFSFNTNRCRTKITFLKKK